MKKNDFLRQVIGYEYPTYEWEDYYYIRPQHRQLVIDVLNAIRRHGGSATHNTDVAPNEAQES